MTMDKDDLRGPVFTCGSSENRSIHTANATEDKDIHQIEPRLAGPGA